MQEEISLRELIEIILKGKWVIAVFTAICIIVSGILSFFVIKPTYEASTTLMISPITNTKSIDPDNNQFFNLVGSLSQYPQMTIDTYKEQVKTSAILADVAKQLGTGIDWSAIANKVSVGATKNTNLITISVTDSSPEEAAKLANLISERFSGFVSQTTQKQAEQSAAFIKEQQDKEKVNLDKGMEELKQYISQPRGADELKLELESKLQQLTTFKTDLANIKIDEQATQKAVEKGKAILNSTPQKIITEITLSNNDLLMSIVKDKVGENTSDIAGLKLSNEQLNEVYTNVSQEVNILELYLAKLSSKRQDTESQISVRQKEIEKLQAEYAEKNQKLQILNNNVNLIKQTYEAYQQTYKEALIKQSAETGKSSIVVISQALPPVSPVGPRKLLNVAIAMVLGIMVSVFYIFAKEYWKISGKDIQYSSDNIKA